MARDEEPKRNLPPMTRSFSLGLIELRERLRMHPEAEAEQAGLSRLELEVLRESSGRPHRTRGGPGHRAPGRASQSDKRWLAGMANAMARDEHLACLS